MIWTSSAGQMLAGDKPSTLDAATVFPDSDLPQRTPITEKPVAKQGPVSANLPWAASLARSKGTRSCVSYTKNRAMSNPDGLGTFSAIPYSMEGELGPAATDKCSILPRDPGAGDGAGNSGGVRMMVTHSRPATSGLFRLWPLILCLALSACSHKTGAAFAEAAKGGNVKRGQQFIYSYSCGACHTIPGVAEAKGTVGPPLQAFAERSYIAGSLENTPENLAHWIRTPQQIEPGTAMPDLGVTREQAVDIAAYLYTLR